MKPVVTVAGKGLSESVVTEINRALNDHELIKIKIVSGDREDRNQLIDALIAETGSIEIQRIGNLVLIFRAATEPSEQLSNLKRYSHIV